MPVYAYACAACGHAFDARQSFDEPALTVCERCGGALRKQYGSIGVTFNGPGFYRTDSRSTGSSTSPAPAATGASSKSASGSTASSTASSGSSGAGTAA
ncbi:FmdB family zinc ribbon protein [Agrococcus sp. Marseille-Q4369]|uniref:FmdB family zinc ribbon protein n=1 Tax=Agrococcus sp. Marseille-Q4369 TaxID=2810513 RepID=UPI001B8ABD3D|nr:FmdB family zinc ribbon protein [Agrococcus sp. Marseille-Q4369]QUW19827.1 FmdB family transcriptional regulator [Agrococcus sp. Marseille-Q4369]